MSNYKIKATGFPVRTAALEDGQMALYHTDTFSSIYLDETSFEIWRHIKAEKELTIERVVRYIVDTYGDDGEFDIRESVDALVGFLAENRFVEVFE